MRLLLEFFLNYFILLNQAAFINSSYVIARNFHGNETPAHVCHYFPSGRGKNHFNGKLLLYGGAIQLAGSVKGRKAARHATSDWMEMEKERGISVTTSVMQFEHKECIVNLLDTAGHEDFSEDTYRTLTAVDSALMVIDVAKGVEERTISLMEVCRLRDTPILTFINKLTGKAKNRLNCWTKSRMSSKSSARQ